MTWKIKKSNIQLVGSGKRRSLYWGESGFKSFNLNLFQRVQNDEYLWLKVCRIVSIIFH